MSSLSGGGQVDGSPSASSTDAGKLAGRTNSDLSGKIGEFSFLKWSFYAISTLKTDFSWVRLGIAETHAKRRGRL